MITDKDWYGAIIGNILDNGADVGPRGLATREVVNVSARIRLAENIVVNAARAPNYRFMVAEYLWMANGRADLGPLTRYNPHMAKFSDDGAALAGAYGPWFKLGIGRAFALLRKDPDTRQAFVKIGDPAQADSKDVPCTESWQFLVRDGCLHMVANMRSSDAWLGIPYDVYSFSQIANAVAGALNLPRGWLYLNLASSHLYATDLEKAEEAAERTTEYGYSLALDGLPPAWTNQVLDDPRCVTGSAFFAGAVARPEYGRLCLAMTTPRSADCLRVLLDGVEDQSWGV